MCLLFLLVSCVCGVQLVAYFPLDSNAQPDCGGPACLANASLALAVSGNSTVDNGVFGDSFNSKGAFAGSEYNSATQKSLRRCLVSPSGSFVDPGNEFSLTAWVKFDSKLANFTRATVCGGGLAYYGCLFHVIFANWGHSYGGRFHLAVLVNDMSNEPLVEIEAGIASVPGGATTEPLSVLSPKIAQDVWVHVAATASQSMRIVRLFLDGVVVANVSVPSGRYLSKDARNNRMSIGCKSTESGLMAGFNYFGSIADVALYSGVLRDDEVVTAFRLSPLAVVIPPSPTTTTATSTTSTTTAPITSAPTTRTTLVTPTLTTMTTATSTTSTTSTTTAPETSAPTTIGTTAVTPTLVGTTTATTTSTAITTNGSTAPQSDVVLDSASLTTFLAMDPEPISDSALVIGLAVGGSVLVVALLAIAVFAAVRCQRKRVASPPSAPQRVVDNSPGTVAGGQRTSEYGVVPTMPSSQYSSGGMSSGGGSSYGEFTAQEVS